jgi:hypothetical protein
MRKVILILAAGLLLAACESEAERRAKWIAHCAENEFTPKQCVILYQIAKDTQDAKNSAAAANFATGLSVGIATGNIR